CCRLGPEIWRREDRVLQRRTAFTTSLALLHQPRRLTQNQLRITYVLVQILNDRLNTHRIVTRMPAIVISNERERRVTDLRFARELRFLKICHADDVHPPGAIDVRLREG